MACVLWKNYMFKNRSGKGTKKGAKMELKMELKWSLGRSRVRLFAIFGRLGRRSFFDAFLDVGGRF